MDPTQADLKVFGPALVMVNTMDIAMAMATPEANIMTNARE